MKTIRSYIAILKNSFYQGARSRAADRHSLRQKFLTNVLNDHLKNNLYHIDGRDIDFTDLVKDFIKDNYNELSVYHSKSQSIQKLPEKLKDDVLKKDVNFLTEKVYYKDKLLTDMLQDVIKLSLNKHYKKLNTRRNKEVADRTAEPENYQELLKTAEYARISMKRYKTASEEERLFWLDLAEKYAREDIADPAKWYTEQIEKLDDITERNSEGKTTKYTDKVKRLLEMSKAINLEPFNKKGWGYGIQDMEIDFKIPDQWKIKGNPTELREFMKGFQKKHFPDYDVLYAVVHCDENPDNPHCHLKLSGKNNKTGNYDISNQIYQMVKTNNEEHYLSIVQNGTILNNSLTEEQRIKLWEEWQTIVLKEFENNLNEKHNLTEQIEIVKDPNQTIKKSKKTSNDREFNAKNKAEQELAQAVKKLAETNEAVDKKINSFENVYRDVMECQKSIFKSLSNMFKIVKKYVFNKQDLDELGYRTELNNIQTNIEVADIIINNNYTEEKERELFKDTFWTPVSDMIDDMTDIVIENRDYFTQAAIDEHENIKTIITDKRYGINDQLSAAVEDFDFEIEPEPEIIRKPRGRSPSI